MAKLELTGKVLNLHRLVLHEKSPFVVRVELDCWHGHAPHRWGLRGRPQRHYELEFFVDDEEAKQLRPQRPIRISLRQD
jgi:hypothetical protein